MLQAALKSGYEFRFFNNFNSGKNICVLRHDVDADLSAALEMAEIEFEIGVKSTYFLMTRSSVYNLFSRVNMQKVKAIIDLGHQIGLHFDSGYLPHADISLEQFIDAEADYLAKQFQQKIKVVSFHQPGSDILSGKVKLKKYLNTYDKNDMKGLHYVSDSNKVWKQEHPYIIFKQQLHKKLQLLIHPMWWAGGKEITSTSRVWDKTLERNFKNIQNFLINTEGAYQSPGKIKIVKK